MTEQIERACSMSEAGRIAGSLAVEICLFPRPAWAASAPALAQTALDLVKNTTFVGSKSSGLDASIWRLGAKEYL